MPAKNETLSQTWQPYPIIEPTHLPLNAGTSPAQASRLPMFMNCPIANSNINIGIPDVKRHIKYGIRKAPGDKKEDLYKAKNNYVNNNSSIMLDDNDCFKGPLCLRNVNSVFLFCFFLNWFALLWFFLLLLLVFFALQFV
jgi:hypothetical protein